MVPNEYNLRPADSSSGFTHLDLTKKLISEAMKGKSSSAEAELKRMASRIYISGIGAPMYGKFHSIEARDKIRNANLNKKLSKKTKAKISTSMNSKKMITYVYDWNTNELLAQYTGQRQMSKYMGIDRETIRKYRDSGKPFNYKGTLIKMVSNLQGNNEE